MRSRIQKWGNSLALRIPKAFADETGLSRGSAVEIVVSDGRIMISPAHDFDLDTLLAGVTDDNRHDGIDTGAAVGNEVW